MSGMFRLGTDELGPIGPGDVEAAREAIAALELAADEAQVLTGPAFSDRVMAALADEPSPAPTGFLVPIRRRGLLAGFIESVRQAWASVGAGRPAFGRAAALAYVLVVAVAGTSLLGAATFGAAGALGLLGPQQTAEPSPRPSIPPVVTPSPSVVTPSPSVTPSFAPEPSETPEGPESSDDHGGNSGPGGTDDHGGNSGPGGGGSGGSDDGSSGSGSGSGGSGGSDPSGTDDHDGSSGGGSSGSSSGSGDDSSSGRGG